MLILDQICPHLLHFIKSLPACVLSTPNHVLTLSSVKTTLNQVQQFIKISVLKLLISPNLICTLQDLVQAPPILPDLHLSCSKHCCCVFLRLLQSRSAPTRSSFIKHPWWFILVSASPRSPIMKYQIMVVLSFSKLLQSRLCSSNLVSAPPISFLLLQDHNSSKIPI